MQNQSIISFFLLLIGLYGAYTIGQKNSTPTSSSTNTSSNSNGLAAQQLAATQFYPVYFTAPDFYRPRRWRRGRR